MEKPVNYFDKQKGARLDNFKEKLPISKSKTKSAIIQGYIFYLLLQICLGEKKKMKNKNREGKKT